jgi:hypothetical protein
MAQLFLDNPSLYSSATGSLWWAGGTSFTSGGNFTVVNTNLPPGSQSGSQVIFLTSASEGQWAATNNYGAQTRLIGSTLFSRTPSTSGLIFVFCTSTGIGANPTACGVAADNAGTYLIATESNTIVATGPVIAGGAYHNYELDATFSTTGTGSMTLYLDGNPTPFLSATGINTGQATAGIMSLGCAPGAYASAACGGYYANSYLFNSTGLAPWNGPLAPQGLGNAKTGFALMTGPGVTSAWTPNGAATDWQCTIAVPPVTTPFASSGTVGQSFFGTLTSIPGIAKIIGAQISTYAMESTTGARAFQSGFSNGSTEAYSGTNNFLATSSAYFFDEYEINPVTGLPWAVADLPSLQMGEQLVF